VTETVTYETAIGIEIGIEIGIGIGIGTARSDDDDGDACRVFRHRPGVFQCAIST